MQTRFGRKMCIKETKVQMGVLYENGSVLNRMGGCGLVRNRINNELFWTW